MKKNNVWILLVVVAIIVIAGGWWLYVRYRDNADGTNSIAKKKTLTSYEFEENAGAEQGGAKDNIAGSSERALEV